jgi:Protein of unknown function (DUF2961)
VPLTARALLVSLGLAPTIDAPSATNTDTAKTTPSALAPALTGERRSEPLSEPYNCGVRDAAGRGMVGARQRFRRSVTTFLMVVLAVVAFLGAGHAAAAPLSGNQRGPIGWDAFRRLDLLPYVRQGVQTFQVSSADPTDNNDDGGSGRYSCLHRVPQGCVMAEHSGPGELESVWSAGYNSFAGQSVVATGRLRIELDGHVVVNKSLAALVSGQVGEPFVFPLALDAVESSGGFSINVPMPFRHEMRVVSQFNPHYFHVVYRSFTSPAGIRAPTARSQVPGSVEAELLHAGMRDPKPTMGASARVRRGFRLAAGQQLVLAGLKGSGAITQLRLGFERYGLLGAMTAEGAASDVFTNARLRISFDGLRTVDAPLGEFFGSGLGPARVRSLMFAMDGGTFGIATSWWPMPFSHSAQVALYNASHTPILIGNMDLRWARDKRWVRALGAHGDAGYFHAQGYSGPTKRGVYWTFLDARGSGTFVGVTLTMEGGLFPIYLEGNERAYVDGAKTPQIQGTGTEDFFGGGWYFNDRLFSLALSGYTAHGGDPPPQTGRSPCPVATCKTAYRIMIADAVPFSHSILYEIQHGSRNLIDAIYSSTAYWYQRP